MIQSTLFFILGFLSAAFLALIVAPTVWRRAVALTRKRIEASMPMTLNEMQAETDNVRAEAAMTIRRLEISVKSLKEKTAEQLVEINRSREELKRLAGENAEKVQGNAAKARSLGGFEAKAPELHTMLQKREQQIDTLTRKLGEADNLIAKRAAELEDLGKMYEEVSFVSSSRQIELAGAEEEIERLSTDMSRLRSQRKDAEQRLQEIATENQALEEALKTARKRIADTDRKAEQTSAMLADSEETLGSRDRELPWLHKKDGGDGHTANGLEHDPEKLADFSDKIIRKNNNPERDEDSTRSHRAALDLHLAEVQAASMILQAELAEASQSPSRAVASGEETIGERVARLSVERDRLERRFATFARENSKLRASAGGATKGVSGIDGKSGEDALLREQIHELAAEVVSLTATLEGPGSPIGEALALPSVDGPAAGGSQQGITSLADRVRALQKAASQT